MLTIALGRPWASMALAAAFEAKYTPFRLTSMVDSQRFTPPTLRRLGVALRAEDIARAAWRQVHAPRVHRVIHWLFTLMYWAGQLSPLQANRMLMAWLSRE